MNKEQAVNLLVNEPIKIAHAIGFTKLKSINNIWIREMVSSKEDKTLQASRGTYKTTCASIALANIMLLLPRKRCLFMRKTDTDVKEIIRQTQNILKTDIYRCLSNIIYGKTIYLTIESATEISTNIGTDIKGTPQLVGMGLGSSLTGKHFDYIFTDDIVNIKDRVSKAERERTKILYQELQNIKNRGGKIFNTGTPWHKDDCFSIMPEPEKYNCYHEGIRTIISEKEIEELKKSMLPSLFSANYELKHIASEDVIFTNPQTDGEDTFLHQAKYLHIDASYGGADYTACTIIARKDNKIYALGKMWHKHVDECLDEIISIGNRYNIGKYICEKNADKGYLAKELRRKGQRAVTYHEDLNKFLKITIYLKGAWDNVIFVKGTDTSYLEQILDFNENAEHDDAPDSLASIIRKTHHKREGVTYENL